MLQPENTYKCCGIFPSFLQFSSFQMAVCVTFPCCFDRFPMECLPFYKCSQFKGARDFPSGPVTDSVFPMLGAQV